MKIKQKSSPKNKRAPISLQNLDTSVIIVKDIQGILREKLNDNIQFSLSFYNLNDQEENINPQNTDRRPKEAACQKESHKLRVQDISPMFKIRKSQLSPYHEQFKGFPNKKTEKRLENEKNLRLLVDEQKKNLNKGTKALFHLNANPFFQASSQINIRTLKKIYGNPPEKKPECFRKLFEREEATKLSLKSPLFEGKMQKSAINFALLRKFPKIS